ncbi:Cadherin domain protein [Anatilimnocola aggregata]|uniref:Cadherin domain protein n=1 Tax=Anatilimnocola aggregata TaxID=2528021 RepID=A0A517Y7A3_9BACT|nr:right-handed parallel beta-helix repeat-containing protein [Anatilimnocola aggregata]QDU26113.1 Cadherin domain protein [Anatilimnocola aggregata]
MLPTAFRTGSRAGLLTGRRLRLEQLEARLALATFYVSNAGSDTNNGSAATPWSSLQKAANVVNAGDTVIVRAGNYTGFELRRDGTASARIVFQAEAGVNITSRNAMTPDGINLEGADYVTIDGFTVNNMPRTGIRSVTNHHVILRNNKLDSNGRWGILTGFSDDILIENNVASRSVAEHGIYVSNSGDRPIIRNNTIWGNRANGIHMNGDLSQGGDGIISGAIVEGNTIYGNGGGGGSGINGDGVQSSTFRNNLIYDSKASGISLYRIDGGAGSSNNTIVNNTVIVSATGRWALNIQDGSTGNTVRNNVFYNYHSYRGSIDISANSMAGFTSDYNVIMNRFTTNGGDSIQTLAQWRASSGQDQHSIVATPTQVFVNPAAFDFHLLAGGPAINAGTSQFAPAVDLAGNARPQGGAWDIGAYEYTGTTNPPPPPPPPINSAPTDIALSAASVKENVASGTVVGLLTATDPNAGQTHTFTLVQNAGGQFAISGNKLVVSGAIDFEAASSRQVVIRATDSGGLSYDETFTITVQNVNEVVGIDVQQGAQQRSYVRYVDVVFESADGLADIVSQGRLSLTRFSTTGTAGVNVSLANKARVVGNRVVLDFGAQGIGGNRNSAVGDGYYRVRVDTDGDRVQETAQQFYRLFGDTDGNRTVNNTDVNNVNANFGRTGVNNNADINGDGVVNTLDRTYVRSRVGRSISASLPLND